MPVALVAVARAGSLPRSGPGCRARAGRSPSSSRSTGNSPCLYVAKHSTADRFCSAHGRSVTFGLYSNRSLRWNCVSIVLASSYGELAAPFGAAATISARRAWLFGAHRALRDPR